MQAIGLTFLRNMVRTDPDMDSATVIKLVHTLHRINFINP
jgi:hypothetical protein